ncbi:MAG TPA: DUF6249 domain-containing protein [Thermoanaerobaculia bacterium]
MDHLQNVVAVLLVLGTPCVAIIGGIVAGILKTRGQQRLIELAQRERIAAIEKGLDISQLTLPAPYATGLSESQAALRKAQGLMIGGLMTLALGLGLSLMLLLMAPGNGHEGWPVGLVPMLMGIALLIAARLIRQASHDDLDQPVA